MIEALPHRLRAKIEVTETCWLWRGSVKPDGYGKYGGQHAHRRVYEALVAPIAAGLQLDHLCEVLLCVNPQHLEPVTDKENKRRRNAKYTHCKHGHEFAAATTYILRGHRHCRPCNARRVAESKARRQARGAS